VESLWRVTSAYLTSAGRRYTVVLGEREWIVLHTLFGGWQFWNGHARCEANAGVKASIHAYEKENYGEYAEAE
jgi:hypothetical protein